MDYGAILILPGRLMEKKKENFKQTTPYLVEDLNLEHTAK
jgi:hypothetical protein